MIYLLLFLVLLGCAPLLALLTAVAAVVSVALRAVVVVAVVLVQVVIVGLSATIAVGALLAGRSRNGPRWGHPRSLWPM